MFANAEIIIFDCLNCVLTEASVGEIVNNDRSALHGALQIFNAGASEIWRRYFRFLPDHHFEKCFQKTRFSSFALPVNEAKHGIRQSVLIISCRNISHDAHKRRAEEPVREFEIAILHACVVTVEFAVSIHVLDEE